MKRFLLVAFALVVMTVMTIGISGCAGCSRDLSSFGASNFGSDWVVVQLDYTMTPKYCWKLHDTAIDNESQSDGIFWKDPSGSHLVHISGWYNRVQVKDSHWEEAAKLVGVDINKCGDGKYTE